MSDPILSPLQAGEIIPQPSDEFAHKLTPDEERVWERTKGEPNTREDWLDLNATIVAYRRRRIARHLATEGR